MELDHLLDPTRLAQAWDRTRHRAPSGSRLSTEPAEPVDETPAPTAVDAALPDPRSCLQALQCLQREIDALLPGDRARALEPTLALLHETLAAAAWADLLPILDRLEDLLEASLGTEVSKT